MPSFLQHHIHHPHHQMSEMTELYISRTIRAFALALFSVFVPVYLINLGFSISMVIYFYILTVTVRGLSNIPTAYLIAHFGPKHVLAMSYFLSIFYATLLVFLPSNPSLLWLTGFIFGISSGMFWMALHVDFSKVKTAGKSTRQVGVVTMLYKVSLALGPLIGGIISTQFSVAITLLVAIALLCIAVVPLFWTAEALPTIPFKIREMKETFNLNHYISGIGINFQTAVVAWMWVLFIFMFLEEYQQIGGVVSVSILLSLVFAFFIAKKGDEGGNSKQVKVGSGITSGTHLFRSVVDSALSVVGLNVINEVGYLFLNIPYVTTYYQNADQTKRVAYIATMQTAVGVGFGLAWLIFLFLSFAFSLKVSLIIMFILAAPASLFVPLINKD